MEVLEPRNRGDLRVGGNGAAGCGGARGSGGGVRMGMETELKPGPAGGEGAGGREPGWEEREEVGGEKGEEEEEEERAGSGAWSDPALRCQVRITTRHSLQLRMANHTGRDVYVRLLGHGDRVSGTGLSALKDSVHLSPLKPLASPAEAELQGVAVAAGAGSAHGPRGADEEPCPRGEGLTTNGRGLREEEEEDEEEHEEEEEEETSGALTISELVYSPCASMLPTPVDDDDGQGGVDLLFLSPAQSPARMLRELHADPDVQRRLAAGRERDRAYERARRAGRSALAGGLRLLSGSERVNACVLSAARLVAVVTAVLLVAVPTLLLLLESDLDVSFLHEIRQTPEFEQFHYEYYCPLRRWLVCKVRMVMERLGAD